MSSPATAMLNETTGVDIQSSKFTNSGRDTTQMVQNNYIIGGENLAFPDVIGYIKTAAQYFVPLTKQSIGADKGSSPQVAAIDHTPQSCVSEHDPVEITDIVPEDPSSLPVSSIADRYTRSMLECLIGYPLYEPRPFSQLSKVYPRNGVNVGDVGFVRKDGTFDFLFNICPPRNALINPSNLPDGFSLETPDHSETKSMSPLPSGTCIFPQTITKTALVEYTCKGPDGAVLVLPEGAVQDEAIDIGWFEDLAKRYGVEWYKYTLHRGRSISNGSLYLVTSFTKCTQWSIAVFDRPCEPGQALKCVSDPLGWSGLGALMTKVADPKEGNTPNQCVFLQGYKIMIREDIFKSLPKRQPAHRIRGGGGNDFFSKIRTGLNSLSRTKKRTTKKVDDVVLQPNFNSPPAHPSDLINSALLNQNPEATVALTHDSVWCDLLRNNFPKLDYTKLRNIARSYTSAVDEYGSISLKKIPDSLLPPLTQRDLPSDPNLYKAYLCRAFNIQFADVIDLTGYVDRRRFIAAGGSGEVWEASWTRFDKNPSISTSNVLPKVVIKLFRLPPLSDEVSKHKRYKRIKGELLLWSKLNHPQILPLVGIARIGGDANLPAFISPLMENGNVMEFLRRIPLFPASKFLEDIIKGLRYLHTFKPVIVHGDIKGSNVLINRRNEACLSDFGLSRFVIDNAIGRTTTTHANGTLRWMAPELIEGDMPVPTIATDMYAFGMTCYEILSRGPPFSDVHDIAVLRKVINGERPERIESCFSDSIWDIITRCWVQEPENRPSSVEVSQSLLATNVANLTTNSALSLPPSRLSSPSWISPFAKSDWPSGPTVLTREFLPRRSDLPSDPNLYKIYLCRAFGIESTDVVDLTGYINRHRFIAEGGSSEVWEASWLRLDEYPSLTSNALPKVVVKLIRLSPLRDEASKNRRYKRIKGELLIWSKLNHPNILPLVGIACIEGDANLMACISPLMENGNAMQFLKRNPSFPAFNFLEDIINGLHYLHTFDPVIVHGDIKGSSVLIDHRKDACLSGFDLSRLIVDKSIWYTTATRGNGTLRWMAPELIESDTIIPTIASDIYAFGMTCYEILSRQSPFEGIRVGALIRKVTRGQRPERIESCFSDSMWDIITRCWAQNPEDRPSTEETLNLILNQDDI